MEDVPDQDSTKCQLYWAYPSNPVNMAIFWFLTPGAGAQIGPHATAQGHVNFEFNMY